MKHARWFLPVVLVVSPPGLRVARAQDVADAQHRVLFLLPDGLPAPERRALTDALEAQFSLGETVLVIVDDELPERPLGARIAAARQRALDTETFAVCWIDPEPSGRWLLHVLDPATDRLVVRPLEADEARLAAAIEAVAVMTRDSAEAIATGGELRAPSPEPAAAAVPPAPPTPAPVPASREPERPLRLAVGYAGHDFAPDVPWRHGVLVSGTWMLSAGPFFGLAWMATQDAQIAAPIRFEVERPLVLTPFGGYRWQFADFSLDAIAGFTFDVWARQTPAQAGTQPASDRSRLVTALSPRTRIEWAASAAFGLYLSAGLDVLLSNFEYLYEDTQGPRLLAPHRVRPIVSAGVAIHP